MERGSTKHGQAHDDEVARETEPMKRGAAQRPRTEEWREPDLRIASPETRQRESGGPEGGR